MAKSDGSTASYYELPPGCTELAELILYRDMNHNVGTIFSSCYRYGQVDHSDRLREAKKMMTYALFEVYRLEKYEAGKEIDFDVWFSVMRGLLSSADAIPVPPAKPAPEDMFP